MNLDSFQYSGRRALVIGGATGMGAATTRLVSELGGSVVVMDVAEIDGPAEQKIRCLLYTSPSPRDATLSRMPSSA